MPAEPQPVTYTLEALLEYLGALSGPELSEEAREIFPPVVKDIADPVKHAFAEAARVFDEVPRVRRRGTSRDAKRELVKLSKLVFDLQVARGNKFCEEVERCAYALGLLIGRLQAREHESDVVRGRKRSRHDRAFHERTHGSDAAKLKRWTAIRMCWDTERATPDHKDYCLAAIDGIVARKLSVGVRTVQNVRLKYLKT